MPKAKVAVPLDAALLRRIDQLVRTGVYRSRSIAVEAALTERVDRLERRRLAEQCALLDPAAERAMAEEGLVQDAGAWPEY